MNIKILSKILLSVNQAVTDHSVTDVNRGNKMYTKLNQKHCIITLMFMILFMFTGPVFSQPVDITGVSPASGTQAAPASATMYYNVATTGTVIITLNGVTKSSSTKSPGSYSYTFSNLSAETHSFGVSLYGYPDNYSYVVNNALPTASINSISPGSAVQGTSISFSGSGSDPDGGVIQAYSWRSSIDGTLSSSASFSTSSLSIGSHTIYLKVQDNEGAWSSEANSSVTINSPPPSVTITNTNPSSGTATAPVSVTMYYTLSQGGTVYRYLDGVNVSTTGLNAGNYAYTYTSLSPGTHTFSVGISNSNGSDNATTSYVVQNALPVASINYISPSSVYEGSNIAFNGSGSDPDGGSVTGYNWRSSIDGQLGTSSSLAKSTLSVGTHTIYFKVKDDEGDWSPEVTGQVTVNPIPDISISIDNITLMSQFGISVTTTYSYEGTVSIYFYNTSNGTTFNVSSAGTSTKSLNADAPGTYTIQASLTTSFGSANAYQEFTIPNPLPSASITSISPGSIYAGDNISFNGSGSDPDGGSIIGYNWRSSIDGQLGTSSSFVTNALSVGTHTIYFKVKDDEGDWSPEVTEQVTVNPIPDISINIDNITLMSYLGITVTTTYSYAGTVSIYFYNTSNGTTFSVSSAGTSTKSLNADAPGTYTIQASLTTSFGSANAYQEFTIPNPLPTASITSIAPNPIYVGDNIDLNGSGSDPDGGSITGYTWRSSIDGQLGTSSSLVTNILSVGTHTIYFKVKDDEGDWSPEVSAQVVVNPIPNLSISIDNITLMSDLGITVTTTYNFEGTVSIYFYNTSSGVSFDVPSAGTSTKSLNADAPGTYTIQASLSTRFGTVNAYQEYTFYAYPEANITNIAPNPAYAGENISLTGSGSDPDGGSITGYNWRSSIDGQLGTTNSIVKNNLSVGTHTIYFKVMDDEGEWSPEAAMSLIVEALPTLSVTIDDIVQMSPLGIQVTVSYNYAGTVNIGFYNTQISTSFEAVSAGTSTVSLNAPGYGPYTVQASLSDSRIGTVNDYEDFTFYHKPIAEIVRIVQNPSYVGEYVVFTGGGSDPDGGTLTEFIWRSSIDDTLSTADHFAENSLSLGTHIIYYKVRDDEGVWSDEVTDTLIVQEKPQLSISIDNIVQMSLLGILVTVSYNYDGDVSVYFYNTQIGTSFEVTSEGSNNVPLNAPSPGTYTIQVSLTNSQLGTVNDYEEFVFPNSVPSANIISITPNPVFEHDTLMFNGSGSDPDGGDIQAYKWRSSLSGYLSSSNTFVTDTLKIGLHKIYFQVQDDEGAWSQEDSMNIEVKQGWDSLSYKYDNLNNIIEINANGDVIFKYEYDTQGRLDKVKTISPNSSETLEADYSYNAADQVGNLQLAVGNVSYGYDSDRGWLETVAHSGNAFSENLLYLNNGNIETQTINNNTLGTNYTYTFVYDNKNRLTNANTALTDAAESYTYSNDGSILTKNRTGNNITYTYAPGKHRLERLIKNNTDTVYYAYDLKGNIYGGDGILMAYNFRNQPVEMINMNLEKYFYRYNSNGERISKIKEEDNSGEYYLRDYTGRELVIYDNETGEAKSVNVFGNGLVGRIEVNGTTDERFYYLKDHLGSMRATLNEYGTVVSAQDYFPYGETIRNYVYGMPIEKYKFNGKERDIESGLDNSVWRYYMSKLGLWPQIDPLSDKYPGLSPYAYALNNPTRYIDPRGMSAKDGEQEQDDIDPLFYLLKARQDGTVGNSEQVTASEVEDRKQAGSSGSSSSLYMISGGLNWAGVIAGTGEYSNVVDGLWMGANGKWNSLSWGGNQWTGARSAVMSKAGAFRIAGRGFFYAGAIISGYEGYTAYRSGNTGGMIKSGLDITMGAIATFGGPPGLVAGGFYFMTTIGSAPTLPPQSYFVPDNTNVVMPRRLP